jgi:hypothetical protein
MTWLATALLCHRRRCLAPQRRGQSGGRRGAWCAAHRPLRRGASAVRRGALACKSYSDISSASSGWTDVMSLSLSLWLRAAQLRKTCGVSPIEWGSHQRRIELIVYLLFWHTIARGNMPWRFGRMLMMEWSNYHFHVQQTQYLVKFWHG